MEMVKEMLAVPQESLPVLLLFHHWLYIYIYSTVLWGRFPEHAFRSRKWRFLSKAGPPLQSAALGTDGSLIPE